MATAVGGAQPAESRRWQAGRCVLALGAVFYGAVDLILRPVAGWRQVVPLNHAPAASVLALFLIVAALELAAGLALLAPSRALGALRAGALALTAVYLVITLLTLPDVVLSPLVFNSWGNLGEQLSPSPAPRRSWRCCRRRRSARAAAAGPDWRGRPTGPSPPRWSP